MEESFTVKYNITTYFWLEAICPTDVNWDLPEGKGLKAAAKFEIFSCTDDSRRFIGNTWFSPFPGCCGIVVSHHTYLNPDSRHSGLSDPFRKLKEKIAKEMGYSLMVATTDMENIPAVGNFFKSNYRIVETFKNSRTQNLLALGIKKV